MRIPGTFASGEVSLWCNKCSSLPGYLIKTNEINKQKVHKLNRSINIFREQCSCFHVLRFSFRGHKGSKRKCDRNFNLNFHAPCWACTTQTQNKTNKNPQKLTSPLSNIVSLLASSVTWTVNMPETTKWEHKIKFGENFCIFQFFINKKKFLVSYSQKKFNFRFTHMWSGWDETLWWWGTTGYWMSL